MSHDERLGRTLRLAASAVLASACGLAFAAPAAAQAPTLGAPRPLAVTRGETTAVTFTGGELDGAAKVWTSFPSQIGLTAEEGNGTKKDQVKFNVFASPNATCGIYGVRVATARGASNLRLIAIDDLPTVNENGQNKTPASAQLLEGPCGVEGTCEPESFDFFKFVGKAGQRVTLEVLARRVGTPLDSVLRILSADGKTELLYSDDEPGSGADSRAAFVCPADGEYLIELRDVRYQGGGAHRYRLRFGDFPILSTTYPLAVQRGATSPLSFVGPTAEGLPTTSVMVPLDAADDATWAEARFVDGRGSGFAPVVVSDFIELVEKEPNDALDQATPIVVPGGVSGKFATPREKDFYQFEAKAGQRFVIQGVTRSLGSPCDLMLSLYNAQGGKIAGAEDQGFEEGSIDFKVPADGLYKLGVEDLLRAGGPQYAYRIEIRPYEPGFTLTLEHPDQKNVEIETLNAPLGGVWRARIEAKRREYNGPITLDVEGAGVGLNVAGNVIEEGKNETVLTVTLPASLPGGSLQAVSIVGRANVNGTPTSARATFAGALTKSFSGLVYPPAHLTSTAGLGVGPVFPDYFKLTVDNNAVAFPRVVGMAAFSVKAERTNGFDDVIGLAVEGLPAGFAVAEAPAIAKGQPASQLKIAGPADAPPGEHKFKIVGNASFQAQPKRLTFGEFTLRVVAPLSVSLAAPAAPITGGSKQVVKVKIERVGEPKEPVTIAFKNLPAGVTVPANLTIPGDKAELDVELTAAADAPAGKVENLMVTATAKLNGQDVPADSGNVVLEVKAAEPPKPAEPKPAEPAAPAAEAKPAEPAAPAPAAEAPPK